MPAAAIQYAPFCALCTSDVGPFAQHPLGRDNGLVWVCRACDEEPAVADAGLDHGYDIDETFRPGFKDLVDAAVKRLGIREGAFDSTCEVRPRTEGWELVRVSRRWAQDAVDAIETLADEPWFGEVRFLGTTAKYHLFERPPT